MRRRTALKVLVGGMGLTGAGAVAGPAIVTAIAPAWRRGAPTWRRLGAVGDFDSGSVALASVERTDEEQAAGLLDRGVYVWRRSGGTGGDGEEFVVFSRACTDLSCPITHDPGSGWYFCPCHGGIFDEEGNPRAGPPSRPLYRYDTRLREGVLEIDLRSVPAHV